MLELMQQAISVIVSDVLAPAVARTGDLDGTVHNIKFSVANYANGSGLGREVLALHFGKSERSIYRYFEQTRDSAAEGSERKVRGRAAGLRKPKKAEPTPHDGVQLMHRILDFFASKKEPVEADACVRYVRRVDPRISSVHVQDLLDLYALMGHLRRITELEGTALKIRYQLPDFPSASAPTSETQERLELLSRKLRALLPLIMAYLRQDEGATIMLLQGRILRRHLLAAMKDIREFTVARWEQARAESLRDDPEGREDSIDACSLVASGPGTLDDLELERSVSQFPIRMGGSFGL